MKKSQNGAVATAGAVRRGRKSDGGAPAGGEGNAGSDGKAAGVDGAKAGEAGKAGADGKAAGNGGETTIEGSELEKMIAKAVGDQLNTHLQTAGKAQLTEDQIKAAVAAAIKEQKAAGSKEDSTALTEKEVSDIVGKAVQGAIDKIKVPAKAVHSVSDADAGRQHEIEIPCNWTKGNLPVHAKQLLNRLLGNNENEGIEAGMLQKAAEVGDRMLAKARFNGAKALTAAGSGTGAELIPSDLSSELMRRLFVESTIAQMFLTSEIDMPTPTYTLPLVTTRPTFFKEATENTAATGSTPGTGNVVLNAVKLMALVEYSYEADEDSIIPVLPLIQQLLGEAAADALESAIINGDTAGTHQDSDINAIAKDAAKSWNGFRKYALAISALKKDLSTGGISRANCLTMLKAMGKYGRRKQDLMWIVSTSGETDFLGLDDVVTVDKRGAAATTITGQLPSYLGIPIVTSGQMRDDLNASGVYDGTTTTKSGILLVNKSQFKMGNRRMFQIETDRNIKSQTNEIVASFRKAFVPIETPSATVQTVVNGYNYAA